MIQFRQAAEIDSHNLKDIAKRTIIANYTPFLGEETATAFIESGMSDKEIDDGINNCDIMLDNEKIIGFAITNEDILHLIMIDVPFQNKGYGSALLAKIEEKLFSVFKIIHLQSFEENISAVKFYLKNGWAIESREKIPELQKTMLRFEKSSSQ